MVSEKPGRMTALHVSVNAGGARAASFVVPGKGWYPTATSERGPGTAAPGGYVTDLAMRIPAPVADGDEAPGDACCPASERLAFE